MLSRWGDTLIRPADRSHLLLLTESPAALSSAVSLFLSDGLGRGEAALILATRSRWAGFQTALDRRGLESSRLQDEGRLVMKDAREVLDAILKDGMPDPERLRSVVGSVLSRLEAEGYFSTRVYGELVSLLRQDGKHEAAFRLEELWNQLARSQRFSLLCSYAGGILEPECHGTLAQQIFPQHSHLVPTDDHDRLSAAVDQAMDDVFGGAHAAALRPIIAASRHRLSLVPGAPSTLFWLQAHLPGRLEDVLASARRRYPLLPASLDA